MFLDVSVRDTIHPPVIDHSETRSPTGSIGSIRSIESRTSVSTTNGSASTVFVPPFETMPKIHSPGSVSRVSRQASLISSHHTSTVDDSAIRGHEYVYLGDRCVIPPSRHRSLRRTTSLTNLDEVFLSDIPRTQPLRLSRGLMRCTQRHQLPLLGSSESSLGANLQILSLGDKAMDLLSGSASGALLSDKEFSQLVLVLFRKRVGRCSTQRHILDLVGQSQDCGRTTRLLV